MPQAALDRATQAAGTAQGLALAAFIVITVTLAINFGAASLSRLAAMPDATVIEHAAALLTIWVSILPAIFFMSALERLRIALKEYARGEFFSPRSARAVRRAGEEALLAMAAKIAIVPTILGWIDHGAPFAIHFELTDLALVAFVFFVAAVGRVLDLAVAIKAENDQIV